MKALSVIIDTDPGVDDFVALMLAKQNPQLKIEGITTVAGNLGNDKVTQNALNIVKFLELEAPVIRGARSPLGYSLESAEAFHGEGGLGGVKLPQSNQKCIEQYAWDFIYEKAVSLKGELEIIALGPLTNLAKALKKYPDLSQHVKTITFMGGSTGRGNRTPFAEFNIWADPLAAHIVFESGIPLKMVGLDVTTKGVLNETNMNKLFEYEHPYKEVVKQLLHFLQQLSKRMGKDTVMLHDALAVASVICPPLLTYTACYGEVEIHDEKYRGQTRIDLEHVTRKQPNVEVAIAVNTPRFIHLLEEMLKY